MSGDSDILAKVEEYLLDDPSISEDFEKFAEEHCQEFDDAEENKLSYMTTYNKFTDLFNQRIEAFITSNGSTLEKFVEACEKSEEESFAVQLIEAITSFEAFKQLMVDEKKKGKYNVKQ